MATWIIPEWEYIYLNPDGQWVSGFKAYIGCGAELFRDYGDYKIPESYFE